MIEKRNGVEPRKEPPEDSYSGYYWGNEPYDSSHIAGRKGDDELKNHLLVFVYVLFTRVNKKNSLCVRCIIYYYYYLVILNIYYQ
jgi:hypothetical protein